VDLKKKTVILAPAKKVGGLLQEFQHFAFKGNVIDLAVGVIIGAAFGKIIDSLVKNILLPLVSVVLPGQHSYENWALVLRGKTVPFGHFVAEIINFLIVSAAMFFFIVKFLGWVMQSKKHQAMTPPTKDQELLMEIRDLLRHNQSNRAA
jgi:large conductance mechanosensitive channel